MTLQPPDPDAKDLSPEQQQAQQQAMIAGARARTPKEWMEIYLALVEEDLKRLEQVNGPNREIFDAFRSSTRPRLRRIGERFQEAGLDLVEELTCLEPEVDYGTGEVSWSTPPRAIFRWPDGQRTTFTGKDAGSAFMFYSWWVHFQAVILGPQILGGGRSRILTKGDADYQKYMTTKAEDQKRGVEPQ